MAALLKARPVSPSQKQERLLGAGTFLAVMMIANLTHCTGFGTRTFIRWCHRYIGHLIGGAYFDYKITIFFL